MSSKFNKPLLRWIIGGTIEQGINILKESIIRTCKVFGDRFDYMICYNNMSASDLQFIKRISPFVTIYHQDWIDCPIADHMTSPRLADGTVRTDAHICGGSLWKLCPPRMRIDSYEIIMDNDIVFFESINQIEEFLVSSRPMLLRENIRWLGIYDNLFAPNEIFNSGFVGLPPGFDYQSKLRKAWKDNGSLCKLTYADEQGLITYVLKQENPIIINPEDIIELHQLGLAADFNGSLCYSKYNFTEKNKAAHFVQGNRNFPHHSWCKYKNECIKLI
jgi:hypothetical protein